MCNDRPRLNSVKKHCQPIVIQLGDDNKVKVSQHGLVNVSPEYEVHALNTHTLMAVMIRYSAMDETCPGPGNRNLIWTTHDLSEIVRDNLTYKLLLHITTSTCATVSSYILAYAAIYGYTALHDYRS